MKKFLLLGCFLSALMLLVPAVVLGSYDYYIPIEVYNNNSTSVTGLPVLVTLNNSQLASLGYIAASGLDTDVQEGSTSREYMVADTRLGIFLPFIDAYQSRIVNYRLGQSPAQSNLSVVLGSGGYFNITDHDNLELGNNFSLRYKGWVDTSSTGYVLTIEGNTTSKQDTEVTSHNVSLPSGIQSGELLLMLFYVYDSGSGTPVATWPSGWTELRVNGSAGHQIGAAYKAATGGEGSNVTVTTSASGYSAHQTFRISDWGEGIGASLGSNGAASFTPDSDSLTSTQYVGLDSGLWFSLFGGFYSSARTVSSYPANYTAGNLTVTTAGFAHLGSARRSLYAVTEDPGQFTLSGPLTGWRAFTVFVPQRSNSLISKASSINVVFEDDDILAVINTTSGRLSVLVPGVPVEDYLLEVWANVTYFGVNLDGITQNSTSLGGTSVSGGSGSWGVGGSYFEYYEHYTNTTLRARYLPNTMISGTTLVDRTGNGHTGTITWGSNPSSIELTIGGLQPFSSYVAPGSEDDEIPDILPVPGSITPDATAGASGQGLPLQANFQAAADALEWTLPTTYSVMFIIVALVMGVAGLAIGSTWGFTIGFGSTSAFFGAVRDSGGALVMPIWITVIMVMIALFIGFVWRSH